MQRALHCRACCGVGSVYCIACILGQTVAHTAAAQVQLAERYCSRMNALPNQSAAANRRPAGQLDGSGNLPAIVAADRAFPAAVAELGSLADFTRHTKGNA